MIEPAFSTWAGLNASLVECIAGLDDGELLLTAGPDRWPLWAVVGHAACQRVFWLCDYAGAPGASNTRFTNAAWNCPGDDDLENVLTADELVEALNSTFAIVLQGLTTWTFDQLDEVVRPAAWEDDRTFTRGAVLQRVHAHDLWHAAEVNEILTSHGRPGFNPWN